MRKPAKPHAHKRNRDWFIVGCCESPAPHQKQPRLGHHIWDAFLVEDTWEEPQPEPGDFWLQQPER